MQESNFLAVRPFPAAILPMSKALVWFRRDLRLCDHAPLAAADAVADQVYCVFLFDRAILDPLPRTDRRVDFIHRALADLDAALRARGGKLICLQGQAESEIPTLARQLAVSTVFASRDYEPAAKARDAEVARRLSAQGQHLHLVKDQCLFDGDEILTASGKPYTVFTPYWRNWQKQLFARGLPCHPVPQHLAMPATDFPGLPALNEIGFAPSDLDHIGIASGISGAERLWQDFQPRLDAYQQRRDFPALKGVSYLSAHLRFGTLSLRRLAEHAAQASAAGSAGAETWLKELAWRDFYFQILDHFPRVVSSSFLPGAADLRWDDWPEGLAAWCAGRTGYPLVDAGMRQLLACGWMHNRLRMLTASFLSKDLGIDWRLGETHFAQQLLDFDLAANNGGWQWSASTGCDAQPWFRIFNPVTQSQKFDPQGRFIRRYLPELAHVPERHLHAPWRMSPAEQAAAGCIIGRDYPAPIVDHEKARQRTLARYAILKRTI